MYLAIQWYLLRSTGLNLNTNILNLHYSDSMPTLIMFLVHYQCHWASASASSLRIMTLLSSSVSRVDRRLCGMSPVLTESISTGSGSESEWTLASTSSTLAPKIRLLISLRRVHSPPISGVDYVVSRRLALRNHFARTIDALWQRYSCICYSGSVIGQGKHCVVSLSFTLYSVYSVCISWPLLELCSDSVGSAMWVQLRIMLSLPLFFLPGI